MGVISDLDLPNLARPFLKRLANIESSMLRADLMLALVMAVCLQAEDWAQDEATRPVLLGLNLGYHDACCAWQSFHDRDFPNVRRWAWLDLSAHSRAGGLGAMTARSYHMHSVTLATSIDAAIAGSP